MAGYQYGKTRPARDVHSLIATLRRREGELSREVERLKSDRERLRREVVAARHEAGTARWQARKLEHELRTREWTQDDWDALLADIRARWDEPDEVRHARLAEVTREAASWIDPRRRIAA